MQETYIPVSTEQEEQLKQVLAKNKMFPDVSTFIDLYNQRYINVKNDEIAKIAKLIKETYKNVILASGYFVIKSLQEVEIENSIYVLNCYDLIARLKRIANLVVETGYPESTIIIINEKHLNKVLLTAEKPSFNEETGKYDLDGLINFSTGERIFRSISEFTKNPFLSNILQESGLREDGFEIPINKIIDIDLTFIDIIGDTIQQEAKPL